MKRFDNRTVIVTGGARGMGASHARGFVAEGANVVIADILEQEGRTLADDLGDHAIFSRLDVTSDRDWAATVAAAEDAFGPVSVLVNNAAIVRFGTIAETDPAAWRQVIDINLTGTYLGIRAVVSSMRKAGGGAIVNTSAGAGMIGQFGVGAYVASKWGVRGMTKTAALELARDNIRVNSIHPGNVRTPMVAGSDAAAAGAGAVRDLAIPRIAEPEEITCLVLFVASDEASFSTGSEFIAAGGHALPTALAAHPARRGSPAGAARSKAQRGPSRPGHAAQERGGCSLKGCPGGRPRQGRFWKAEGGSPRTRGEGSQFCGAGLSCTARRSGRSSTLFSPGRGERWPV